MSQPKHNLYEGMYVIKATLSDDARHKALDRIQGGITSRTGEVVKNSTTKGVAAWLTKSRGTEKDTITSCISMLPQPRLANFGKNTT